MNINHCKTYYNSRESYSFKYPNDREWKVGEELNELPAQYGVSDWDTIHGNYTNYHFVQCPCHGFLRSKIYLEGKTIQAWDDPALPHLAIETFENPEDLPIREAIKKDMCSPYQIVHEYLPNLKGEGDDYISAYCNSTTKQPENIDFVLSQFKDITFKGLPAIEYERVGHRYIFVSKSKKIYHITTYPTAYTHYLKGFYIDLVSNKSKELEEKLLESLSL